MSGQPPKPPPPPTILSRSGQPRSNNMPIPKPRSTKHRQYMEPTHPENKPLHLTDQIQGTRNRWELGMYGPQKTRYEQFSSGSESDGSPPQFPLELDEGSPTYGYGYGSDRYGSGSPDSDDSELDQSPPPDFNYQRRKTKPPRPQLDHSQTNVGALQPPSPHYSPSGSSYDWASPPRQGPPQAQFRDIGFEMRQMTPTSPGNQFQFDEELDAQNPNARQFNGLIDHRSRNRTGSLRAPKARPEATHLQTMDGYGYAQHQSGPGQVERRSFQQRQRQYVPGGQSLGGGSAGQRQVDSSSLPTDPEAEDHLRDLLDVTGSRSGWKGSRRPK
ncbi:hypothetical protein HDE_12422 [Halotydeus destructor]|nr:hypothetical protein HDE_12422 [Halotydeus destructor]